MRFCLTPLKQFAVYTFPFWKGQKSSLLLQDVLLQSVWHSKQCIKALWGVTLNSAPVQTPTSNRRNEPHCFFLKLDFKVFQVKPSESTVWNCYHVRSIYTVWLRKKYQDAKSYTAAHRNHSLPLYFGAEKKEKGQFWGGRYKMVSKTITVWHLVIQDDLYNHAQSNTDRRWSTLKWYLRKYFFPLL